MRLDNKGITLVEIIISVVLISIVMVFLFTMLIQVNNENADNEVRSSYLVNQSAFIKQIEEDFLDYGLNSGDKCDYDKIFNVSGETTADSLYLSKIDGDVTEDENIKCLKFVYNHSIYNYAYLFLYRKEMNKTILSYYRGDYRQSVELEDFDWDANKDYIVLYKSETRVDQDGDTVANLYEYSLPIIGPDEIDYSINLSYATD